MTGLLAVAGPSAGAARSRAFAYTDTRTLTRVHLIDGKDQQVDSRSVTVNVDQTTDLRNRQEVTVSWTGAHPTGGAAPDPNAPSAQGAEYPVAIFECRGTDSSSVPADQQLSPETCWTQSSIERFYADYNPVGSSTTTFPPWRLDRYAAPADRRAVVDAPNPYPASCGQPAPSERWVHFVGADGSDYPEGQSGCAGQPAEAGNYSNSIIPSNETFAATAADGSGSTTFNVWTTEQNTSLGCQKDVACALVVIPIMGISCDPAGADLPAADRPQPGDEETHAAATCTASGGLPAGSTGSSAGAQVTDTGTFWWSASNWRNRFTIPLTFAPAGNICDVVSNSAPVDVYGSELMTEAMTQWEPTFCLDPKLFRLKHIQTGEPQAVNLINTGNAQGALAEDPPPGGFLGPTVLAPAALTGFAVVYRIDDAEGKPYTNLRLTPRLIAKLLSESYPVSSFFREHYPTLANNPINIAADPEFQALNPGLSTSEVAISASTMLMASNDSDVMTALSSYINADPEARAWLDGTPDPWGMVVNPAYKGISLPVTSWPLLDAVIPTSFYAKDPCFSQNPVPYLPLVQAPVLRFALVSQDMQYGVSNSLVQCKVDPNTPSASRLVAIGREPVGGRFLIGLTTLADAARYQIPVAQLQTQVSSQAPQKFTDATGRTFVAPSADSITATAQLLTPDEATHTWTLDYAGLRTAPAAASAYPGAMLISTVVPTSGLSADDAAHYAAFVRFTAGPGQTPGTGQGQLPPGYVPLTAAAGLGAFPAYSLRAADAIAAQKGDVPPLGQGAVSPPPQPSKRRSSSHPPTVAGRDRTNRAETSPLSAATTAGSPTAPTSANGTLPAVPAPAVAPAVRVGEPVTTASTSKTPDIPSAVGRWLFPLIALLAIASGAGAAVSRALARRMP